MSIYAYFAVMVVVTVGTPHRFEVKHVKVHIYYIILDKFYWEFFTSMRERTKIWVVALVWNILVPLLWIHVQVECTKFCLVFVGMIKFLNSIVRFFTAITVGTVTLKISLGTFWPNYIWTHFRLVSSEGPPSVFLEVVIVWTFLSVMILRILRARVHFKKV